MSVRTDQCNSFFPADEYYPSHKGGSLPYTSRKGFNSGGQKQVAFSPAAPVFFSNVRLQQTLSVQTIGR